MNYYPSRPKSSIFKRIFYSLLFIIVLLLIASSIYNGLFRGRLESNNEFYNQNVGVVKREDLIQRITIAGVVEPKRRTLITAPYTGYVGKLLVSVGSKVKAGDPIVTVTQSLMAANAGEKVYPMRAPFSGVVVSLGKAEGEFVKDSDPSDYIVRIDDLSKLYVAASAPELDRVKITFGQEAIVKATAILDRSYKGVIRELSLAAKERDRYEKSSDFFARIELLNPDEKIMPGMSAVIDIITNKRTNVLTLRHEFIQKEADNSYFVTLLNGQRVPIKVGLQNEEAFEIVEGLKEGDRVQVVDFSKFPIQQ